MVVNVRRYAVSFFIDVNNAAVGNSCRRENMPPDQSLNDRHEQGWERINFFISDNTWRVSFFVLPIKVYSNDQYQISELINVKWLVTIGFRLQTHHCIIVTTAKLNSYTAFPAHPFSWFWIRSLYKLLKQMRKKCCTAECLRCIMCQWNRMPTVK